MMARSPLLGVAVALLLLSLPTILPPAAAPGLGPAAGTSAVPAPTPVANYTSAIQRIVTLLGLSGSGLLAIVWARVALSWFSNDVTKKVQAKDRARDALIGTILFTAAVSGLLFGLAQWIVTGS